MLMDKLSAINDLKTGQINAISSFIIIWTRFIDYWNNIGTFNIDQEIHDLQ